MWYVLFSSATGSYPTASIQQQWGLRDDVPVPGDYDADGKTDFAVWRPSSGTWYVLFGSATASYPAASILQQWGLPSDVPVHFRY
jgi:hypothetical protein